MSRYSDHGPSPSASESPGNLLKMQLLGPHPGTAFQQARQVIPMPLQFENLGSGCVPMCNWVQFCSLCGTCHCSENFFTFSKVCTPPLNSIRWDAGSCSLLQDLMSLPAQIPYGLHPSRSLCPSLTPLPLVLTAYGFILAFSLSLLSPSDSLGPGQAFGTVTKLLTHLL